MNLQAFTWLLKREFWENRGGFWTAPLVTAAIFLALNALGLITAEVFRGKFEGEIQIGVPLNQITQNLTERELEMVGHGLNMALASYSFIIYVVLFFVLFFYLLGALYDERKDRSVLFWKSLPISDTSTVLSKVASALLVAPLLALGVTILSHIALLTMLSLYVLAHGLNPFTLIWGPADPLFIWTDHLLTIPTQILWALPAVGWLLLASSWARTKPFLWAVLVPVAFGVINAFFQLWGMISVPSGWYWSNIAGRALLSLSPISWLLEGSVVERFEDFEGEEDISMIYDMGDHLAILGAPETWIGAVIGAALIAGAIYLRRWRDEA